MPSAISTDHSESLSGWRAQDPGRGTWDIITSCFFTILICTWTAIHPRIHVTRRLRNTHKMFQLVKTILAPEMVCLESLQEWVQARKMVKRCAVATDGGLTMLHAFYFGMLGVRYRYGPAGYRTLWPGQFAWLLNNKLTSWADRQAWGLTDDVIFDKSKADGMIKLAALCQVTWFTMQCITRAAHSLPLAPLEVMTIAYVVVMVITYFFWWVKPKDIATATFVSLPQMTQRQWEVFESLSMENTYDVLDPNEPWLINSAWYLVARDCKDDDVLVMQDAEGTTTESQTVIQHREDIGSTTEITQEIVEIDPHLERAKPVHVVRVEVVEGDPAVITEWDAALYMTRLWPLICLLGASFGAVHMISWNSTFPTEVELWLWRASAIISMVTSIVCMQFRKMSLRWDGPLTIIRVASPILYVVSRFIMAGETFAALRAMPSKTYDTFEIWNYWFHFL